jgi:hypothetical protein
MALTEVTEGQPNWAQAPASWTMKPWLAARPRLLSDAKSDLIVDWSQESARKGERRRRVEMRFLETEQ